MSKFFDDTMQGLREAVEISKENVRLTEHKGMPAQTFYVAEDDKELIEKIIAIRKRENISQVELAEMTGNSQQSISRMEKMNHSPSIKLISSIIRALGYEIRLVKKED